MTKTGVGGDRRGVKQRRSEFVASYFAIVLISSRVFVLNLKLIYCNVLKICVMLSCVIINKQIFSLLVVFRKKKVHACVYNLSHVSNVTYSFEPNQVVLVFILYVI